MSKRNTMKKKDKKNNKLNVSRGRKIFGIIILIVLLLILFALICTKVEIFNSFPLDFKLKGEDIVTINIGEEYVDDGYSAKFFFNDVSNSVITKNNINNEIPGEYNITYTYSNKLMKKSIIRRVNVIDNIPPTLTLETDKISIYVDGVIYPGKIKAKDNIDGDISSKVEIDNQVNNKKAGKYKVVVSVSDSSGNVTSKDINVTVKEKQVKNGSVNARIDVYISEQKLYYYENNKLILTSDVVTGKKDGTPRGHYKVLRKKKDIYLKGDTFLDHVDYWIAFIGGLYGIHDASWRSEFGGSIYKTNGSHGCVNMPTNNMKKLYEKVKVGTAVNIYD
jgi:lipoprotein-anchoring transpeptidase ErfK/SrfK